MKLFSFVEWCLWNAQDDMTNFQRNFSTGEVEIEGSAIYHKTEYRERRNHYAFYWSSEKPSGFDTDRETFMGLYNGFENPQTVLNGKPANSIAHGWSPIASHCLDVHIKAGETKELIFILGYAENPDHEKFESPKIINKVKAREMISRMGNVNSVNKAFYELKDYWNNLLSIYTLESNDDNLNRMVNIWNPYQCMITFNLSRSASYFESGIGRGLGFRDSNQDLLGFVHMAPARARQRLLDLAATQLPTGGAYHQYQPLTKRGNNAIGGNFNDDPLWLILATAAYLKETGDWSILDEAAPYDNQPELAAPLYDHLQRSLRYTLDRLGPHGLPLIGRADWNDCLNLNCFSEEPGESFQTTTNREGAVAESVFIAGLFVLAAHELADIADHRHLSAEAAQYRAEADRMQAAVDAHGWDGRWFLRAYDAFGRKIGSRECDEGRIFIESNGMCVMAGIGLNDGRAEQALAAVDGGLIVAGEGRLAEFDFEGKLVRSADSPHVQKLPPLPEIPPPEKPLSDEEQKARAERLAAAKEARDRAQKALAAKMAELRAAAGDADKREQLQKEYAELVRAFSERSAELNEASTTPRAKALQARAAQMRHRSISAVAVGEKDVFIACPMAQGFGFAIWRTDRSFGEGRLIAEGLRGCCGQMDIQARGEHVFVAENARKRVVVYDRDGKQSAAWGESQRGGLEGFGSCCNPMNLRFNPAGELITSEASLGRLKRYTPEGRLLGLVGTATVEGGCKNVAVDLSPDGKRCYVMDLGKNRICVLSAKADKAKPQP